METRHKSGLSDFSVIWYFLRQADAAASGRAAQDTDKGDDKVTGPTKPYIRREVSSLSHDDPTLRAYARAIVAMRERLPKDPTSWSYQAAIHGSHATPRKPLWNQCKHGTWYFVAWHRMYVYHFEQIVRAAVIETGGPSDWALPYWNYGLDGSHAELPDAFRHPTFNGEPNPLYVEQRAPGINAGAKLQAAVTSDKHALSRAQFVGAPEFGGGITRPGRQFWGETGRLEQTPHNDIHNAVGGELGWMADPDTAAQDPIFWLHHTNIDRIWAVWNAHGGINPTDPKWANQQFDFFDTKGKETSKTCAEVLDTVADLGYTYDPPPAAHPTPAAISRLVSRMPPPTPPEPQVVGASESPVHLVGAAARVPVTIDARARHDALAGKERDTRRRVFLNVEDIEAKKNPGTVYGIYVNLPEGAGEEELERHHVGNVSFFGIERASDPRDDEHSHGLRVSVEITDFVDELTAQGKWDDEQLHVTFQPLGLIPPAGHEAESVTARAKPPGEDPPVHVGRVSLSYG